MQVQVARISPVVMELAVEVPADAVKAEVEKAYVNLQRKAHVRGFRPGKAPRQVLAHLYGPQVANDVVNALVNDTLPKALTEKNVTPDQPAQVEAGQVRARRARSRYKARFEVQPEIAEVTYEGLELVAPARGGDRGGGRRAARAPAQAARAPRGARSPRARRRRATSSPSTSRSRSSGKELKEAGGEGVQLELGSRPGPAGARRRPHRQERRRRGRRRGQVPRPTPRDRSSQGKTGDVPRQGQGHKQRVLPASTTSSRRTSATSRRSSSSAPTCTRASRRCSKDRAETALAEQIVEQAQREEPGRRAAVARRAAVPHDGDGARSRTRAAHGPARRRRTTSQKVHGRVHADAEKKVRAGLLMAAIAKKLEIKVTDEDIQKGIEELAAETGKNVAKVRAEYSEPQRRQILIGMILEDKVLDVIEGKANITRRPSRRPRQPRGRTSGRGRETARPPGIRRLRRSEPAARRRLRDASGSAPRTRDDRRKRPENRTQAIRTLEREHARGLHPVPHGRRDDPPRRAQLGHLQPPAEGPHRLSRDRDQRRRRQHHHRPVSLSGERRSRQGDHALHQQPGRRRDERSRHLRHHAVRPLHRQHDLPRHGRVDGAPCSSRPGTKGRRMALPNARVMIHQPIGRRARAGDRHRDPGQGDPSRQGGHHRHPRERDAASPRS